MLAGGDFLGYREATKEEKLRFENAAQYVAALEREGVEFVY